MREILFKAKEIHTHKWVEGYYVKRENMTFIYPACPEVISRSLAKEIRPIHSVKSTQKKIKEVFLVDQETVCQYTGLTDKNGVKIFEGDILIDRHGYTGIVKYGDFSCGCCYDVFGYSISDLIEFEHGYEGNEMSCDLEVTGNIHDEVQG